MGDELTTYCENTWCPGCGNFGIFNSFRKAVLTLEEKGVPRERLIITAGIGCSGKIFDYLALSGFYGLHGRAMATSQGIKLANPDLLVACFCGDGDSMGEGLAHMVFAAKRNADITVIMHHNSVYGLTTGQVTPLTDKGTKGPSTPEGSFEEPLNPLTLMLEAGATFVARGYSGKTDHLADLMVKALEHRGFSFLDVLQPCVSFNNTYRLYNGLVEVMEDVPGNEREARARARRTDALPIGVFWQEDRASFPGSLYGDHKPVTGRRGRDARLDSVCALLGHCGPNSVEKGECR